MLLVNVADMLGRLPPPPRSRLPPRSCPRHLPDSSSTIAQVLLVNVADMLGRHAHYTHAQVNMILADIFAVGVFVLGCISDNLAVRVSAWCWAACRTIWQSG